MSMFLYIICLFYILSHFVISISVSRLNNCINDLLSLQSFLPFSPIDIMLFVRHILVGPASWVCDPVTQALHLEEPLTWFNELLTFS